jgi:cis-3-alkyl-4-acyloxetan-2-one decarboxylase
MHDVAPDVTTADPYPEWSGKTAGDYRLAVRIDTRTSGPIVVLLHGLNSDATDWQPVIDDFPMDYRIIAVDLLGYGESPKPIDIDYSCADHVAALHGTLGELDLCEPFLLVGYSLGGDIALNYAAKYPEEVRRLFLLSTPFYLPAEEFEKKSFSFHYMQQSAQEWAWKLVRSVPDDYTKLFSQIDTEGTALHGVAAGVMRTADVERAWTIMGKQLGNAIQGVDFPANLPKITMPTVFALGVRDPIVRQDLVPALRRLKPDMEVRRIQGLNANHLMLLNIPDIVGKEVMKDEVEHLHFPRRFGTGQPMVLLHGQSASSQYWVPFTTALGEHNDVAVVDLLGFGDSPRPISFAYSLDDHVRLLHRTVATRFSPDPLRLVGQSMGALIALAYAAKYPDHVVDLTLFDTPVLLDREQLKRFPSAVAGAASADEIVAVVNAVYDRLNDTLDRDFTSRIGGDAYASQAVPAIRSIREIVAKQDVPALLDLVKVPVKFVYAENDGTVVPEFIDAMGDAYENVTSVMLPGGGNLPVTQPAASLEAIDPEVSEDAVKAAVKATKNNKWWIGGASALKILQSADVAIMTRGIIMLIAGITLAALTGIPIHTFPTRLLAFFAAGYVLFESAQMIVGAVGLRSARKAWLSFGLIGLVGLAAGVFLLLNKDLSLQLILLVVAVRAFFSGIFDLIAARHADRPPLARWWLVLQGILALAFGFLIFFAPQLSSRLLVYILEGYLVVSGVSLIAYAWESRRIARRMTKAKLRGTTA